MMQWVSQDITHRRNHMIIPDNFDNIVILFSELAGTMIFSIEIHTIRKAKIAHEFVRISRLNQLMIMS